MADVTPLLEIFNEGIRDVERLDEVIDAAQDSAGAGRRAVVNQLVKNNEENWSDLANQIAAGFTSPDENGNVPDEQTVAGTYFGLVRELRSKFEEASLKYAESLVSSTPAEKVSAEELATAQAERDAIVKKLRPLKAVIEAMDSETDWSNLKVPRKRPTGGTRGRRAITYYSWKRNGEDFDGSLTELAKELGYEKSVELRDQMKAAGINLTKPPVTIEFTTPAGVVLVGTRSADAPDFDAESENDDPESENDDPENENDDEDENDEAEEDEVSNEDSETL